MFEDNFKYAEIGQDAMSCKRDPEDMLQRVRKQLEMNIKGEDLLLQFVSLALPIHGYDVEEAFTRMLGLLRIKRMELEREQGRWLDEIDAS